MDSPEWFDPSAVVRAQVLLGGFLANRDTRTFQAYFVDVGDFAGFLHQEPSVAVAQLLSGGPGAGHHLLDRYTVDLRRRGRAEATIERRLGTLHSLVRSARDLGMIGWVL